MTWTHMQNNDTMQMTAKDLEVIAETLKDGKEILIKPVRDGFKILKLSAEVIVKKQNN